MLLMILVVNDGVTFDSLSMLVGTWFASFMLTYRFPTPLNGLFIVFKKYIKVRPLVVGGETVE